MTYKGIPLVIVCALFVSAHKDTNKYPLLPYHPSQTSSFLYNGALLDNKWISLARGPTFYPSIVHHITPPTNYDSTSLNAGNDEETCYHVNYDVPGNNIGHCVKTETPEECQKICQSTSMCVQFTWYDTSFSEVLAQKYCCLKQAINRYQYAADIISGPKDCAMPIPLSHDCYDKNPKNCEDLMKIYGDQFCHVDWFISHSGCCYGCKKSCKICEDLTMYSIFTTGYSNKIVWYNVNEDTLKITFQGDSEIENNLSFGAVDKEHNSIYFVHEEKQYGDFTNNGAVSRWTIDKTIGEIPTLAKQEVFPSEGNAPAHVNLDTQNHLLHVTNYDHVSGSYAAYALDKNNGAILGNIYADNFESEIGNATEDQKKSHAHHTVTNGKHVYVVDLGLNKILYYEVQSEHNVTKGSPPYTPLPKGFGPRHMAITTKLTGAQKAYVLNEHQPFVTIFEVNEETGKLKEEYNVETLPADQVRGLADASHKEHGAEIILHPNEKWLYVSHRGTGSIILFEILEDGYLKRTQVQPTSGTWPRHFTISKSGKLMFVALQFKDLIEAFKIETATGRLAKVGSYESVNSPAYVGII